MMTTEIKQDWRSFVNATRRIDAEEYLDMAISHRRLARCDNPSTGFLGFVDLDTGERFEVEAAKLQRLRVRPR